MVNDPFHQNPPDANGTDLGKALFTLRIIWFGLIAGVVSFLVAVHFILQNPRPPHPAPPTQIPILINLLMFVTELPVVFFIRMAIFKRGRVGDGISPKAYASGSIVFWAGCEGIAFFALVIGLLKGSLSPTIWIAAAALALMALTFPLSGKMADVDAGQ